MPGLAVALELAAAGVVRGEPDGAHSAESHERDDVPGVAGNYVSSNEIELAGTVAALFEPVANGDVIVLAIFEGDGLDLHALESAASVHDEVVGSAVAVGLGDVASESESAGEEAHFGPLALAFAAGGLFFQASSLDLLRRGLTRVVVD